MSVLMEEELKRWTSRRKSLLVLEIIRGKAGVAEASRQLKRTNVGRSRQSVLRTRVRY